jgi:hypothetical protein
MARKILIGIAAVLVLLVIVIATRPSTFRIERAASMAAPAGIVYAQVQDFHRWSAWSPWEKLDPAMKREYSGAAAGPGAVYYWNGNDDVGEGRMTIEDAKPGSSLTIKLEFLKPWASTNKTLITFTPDGAGAKVSWAMEGTNDFMGKAMSLFMDLDAMVGPDFEKGLANMKAVAEAEAKKQEEARRASEAAAAAATSDAGAIVPAPAK